MGKKFRGKKLALLSALEKQFGNITSACKLAGVDRSMFYQYKQTDPDFLAAYEAADYAETYKDVIEQKLAKLAVIDEDRTVLIFLAKTICKDRGYIETIETRETNPQIIINEIRTYPSDD